MRWTGGLPRVPRLAAVCLLVGVVLALAAAAILFVSDAHGHGLATGDARAVVALIAGSVGCVNTAVVKILVRRGPAEETSRDR